MSSDDFDPAWPTALGWIVHSDMIIAGLRQASAA